MEARGNPGPRGRARGRVQTEVKTEVESDAEDERMEVCSAPGRSGSSDENGNGGERGGSGGTPRGGPGLPSGNPEDRAQERERRLLADYVVSRPTGGFVKKGAMQHKQLPPPTIVSNYYEFTCHPQFKLRLYSIKVEPETEDIGVVRKLIASRRERLPSYLTTGFMIYTTRPISDEDLEYQANLERQPEVTYKVTLAFVRDLEKSEGTYFQVYNVIVRQMQHMMEYQLLGRHFFDPRGRVPFPSWRLELWPGFQNSIRQQEISLMLNVESVWKVLSTTNVLQVLNGVRETQPANVEQACREAVEGTMVITKYGNKSRAYKISRIDFKSNALSTFDYRGVQTTYKEYFARKYGPRGAITVDKQPMLVSEPTIRDRRRGQLGDIYLVPELCYQAGLNDQLRSNFRLMKDLARCLHMPPGERVATMQQFVTNVLNKADIIETMRKWGVKMAPRPVEFPARFLNTEEILMGDGKRVLPDDKADWTTSFRSQRMLSCARLQRWVIIVTGRDAQGVPNLVGTIQRVSTPLGYQIARPDQITARGPNPEQFKEAIHEAMAKHSGSLDMIFIILPNNKIETYSAVKYRCSVEYGIPSQCFLSKNLNNPKGLMSICTKMVIQMNAKQGGEPWGVHNPLKKVVVLGYDVHHAGPSGGNSIGAMCATTSASLGQYYSCVAQLTRREEVATSVAAMFEKCLKACEKKNGHLPARIFMYRDGVGEGQLKDVFEQEVHAFKDRIGKLYPSTEKPKLTFVVVNKRINTRFFHRKPNGEFQNPRPGLIVDDVVTRPERYDFFLVSPTARQGCVSPTYYNVLLDESELPPDRLQMYTWKLCHLYYNWSGTVAVPGPCQNAHKLAFQVGTALKRPANNKLDYLLHFL